MLNLGKRFGTMEHSQRQYERARDELAEEVDALRRQNGLPVLGLREKMRRRGVPDRLAAIVLAGKLRQTQAVEAARKVATGIGRVVVLSGKAGCGKSVALALALSLRPGVWIHGPTLAIPPRRDDDDDADARMRGCGLLVVDDVGAEHSPSGYAVSRLTDAVVARDGMGRPTLISTNLGAAQFVERYGERLSSRLNGDALGFVRLTDADLRGSGNED